MYNNAYEYDTYMYVCIIVYVVYTKLVKREKQRNNWVFFCLLLANLAAAL